MKSPGSNSARIRVDGRTGPLLWKILHEQRGRLIDEKIRVRDGGGDAEELRRELRIIARLMEEVGRALEELANGHRETLE